MKRPPSSAFSRVFRLLANLESHSQTETAFGSLAKYLGEPFRLGTFPMLQLFSD